MVFIEFCWPNICSNFLKIRLVFTMILLSIKIVIPNFSTVAIVWTQVEEDVPNASSVNASLFLLFICILLWLSSLFFAWVNFNLFIDEFYLRIIIGVIAYTNEENK